MLAVGDREAEGHLPEAGPQVLLRMMMERQPELSSDRKEAEVELSGHDHWFFVEGCGTGQRGCP